MAVCDISLGMATAPAQKWEECSYVEPLYRFENLLLLLAQDTSVGTGWCHVKSRN